MLSGTACIWLETQLTATDFLPQTFGELRRFITIRVLQLEETQPAQEDVVCTCKGPARQQRTQRADAGDLTDLQALGVGTIHGHWRIPNDRRRTGEIAKGPWWPKP